MLDFPIHLDACFLESDEITLQMHHEYMGTALPQQLSYVKGKVEWTEPNDGLEEFTWDSCGRNYQISY